MVASLLLMGAALAYALLILYLEKCRKADHQTSDEEALSRMAFRQECSAFDIFISAGQHWSFSRNKIDCDFNRYLRQGDIPHYVRTYVRRHLSSHRTYQEILFTGDQCPPNANP